MNISWEAGAAAVSIGVAVVSGFLFVRPVLLSDDPPWANVNRVDHAADKVIARIVAGNILAMRTRYCEALRTNNREYALSLNEIVSALQNEYAGLTGRGYPMEPCP